MKFPFRDLSDFMKSKIMKSTHLQKTISDIRKNPVAGYIPTIATINGSFDLLHAGHLYILYEASKTADLLIVALNSDESIARYKNPSRPIIPLQQRMEMIAALSFVDFVTWFEEDTPCSLIQELIPDIHVNGKEYGENCVEADIVRAVGATLHLVERIEGLSTSNIMEKIRATT